MAANFHEDLHRSAPVKTSSDRSFGLVVGLCLAVLGLWPLRRGGPPRLWLLLPAALLLVAGALRPSLLHPLNILWARLGLLLGRIVNPIVTAFLFFMVFTPVGLVARLMGKDLLRLRPAPDAKTYWLEREPPGPAPETMARQF